VPGIFGSIRQGAARAAFEADKLRRANQVQSEISALRRQISRHATQLSNRALELYRNGELAHADLVAECEPIVSLEDEIAEKQRRVEEIQRERMREEAAPAAGLTCQECGTAMPEGASFCPACGAAAKTAESDATVCPNCQASLTAGTVFCPHCGTRVQE
jgi:RNA polymerase subunit RPABC4/transcription elongation factor Spt4